MIFLLSLNFLIPGLCYGTYVLRFFINCWVYRLIGRNRNQKETQKGELESTELLESNGLFEFRKCERGTGQSAFMVLFDKRC